MGCGSSAEETPGGVATLVEGGPPPGESKEALDELKPLPTAPPAAMERPMTPRRRSELAEKRAERLAEVAASLTSETDVHKLALLMMRSARELTAADRASLFLVDADKGELYEFASDEGENSASAHKTRVSTLGDKSAIRVKMGAGLAGHVAATGETLAISDAYDDPRWAGKAYDAAHGYRTKQLLVCPINGPGGKVLGVMEVINSQSGADFSESDVTLLQAMSGSAGVAVQNAVNYRKAVDKERQLNAVLDALDSLLLTFDTEVRAILRRAILRRAIL